MGKHISRFWSEVLSTFRMPLEELPPESSRSEDIENLRKDMERIGLDFRRAIEKVTKDYVKKSPDSSAERHRTF